MVSPGCGCAADQRVERSISASLADQSPAPVINCPPPLLIPRADTAALVTLLSRIYLWLLFNILLCFNCYLFLLEVRILISIGKQLKISIKVSCIWGVPELMDAWYGKKWYPISNLWGPPVSPEQSSSLLSSNLQSLKLYSPAQHQAESLHSNETCSTHFTSRLKKDQRKA